ncbi:hypothetical protein J4P91_18625 [Bacillus sp. XF8]|nr:hypothetical protein [Bacillus sp. XF8]
MSRIITLAEEDKKQLFRYYKTIPEPVRPKYHSYDPLFVAFDFTRGTYHWSYENEAPKGLFEVSVQKMIRLEIACGDMKGIISSFSISCIINI